MTRILIAGCGDIGTRLGLVLTAAGHRVWGLRRNPAALPGALRPLAADLGDPASLTLPAALDAVYYTAAAAGYSEPAYRAAYVDGVANLLTALQHAGQRPRRVFLLSSTSVYGQQHGEWVDEDSPAEAGGFAGRCLRAGERRLLDGPFPATAVRLAGIYGPGRTRLIDSVRNGRARCQPGVYSNRIHSDDAVGLLAHLLTLEAPAPLYIGADDTPAELCAVMRWLAERLGVAGPSPEAGDAGAGRRRRGSKRCRNARLRASGYRLRYPSFREGYAALLATPC